MENVVAISGFPRIKSGGTRTKADVMTDDTAIKGCDMGEAVKTRAETADSIIRPDKQASYYSSPETLTADRFKGKPTSNGARALESASEFEGISSDEIRTQSKWSCYIGKFTGNSNQRGVL